MLSDSTTNGLTQCVIKWIQLNGYQAERISNTGRIIDTSRKVTNVVGQVGIIGGKKWIKGTGTNGTADISATIQGRSVKIEIKFGADRLSQDQIEYGNNVTRAGGVYLVVRDFDQFVGWWDLIIAELS